MQRNFPKRKLIATKINEWIMIFITYALILLSIKNYFNLTEINNLKQNIIFLH